MYFPITIIDDFYENFEDIKKYINTLEFYQKEQFTTPGKATRLLSELNLNLTKKCITKLLSVYYNRFELENINIECRTRFEKITPYGENYNKEGFIHSDDTNTLSAILYVDGDYPEGTSFYKHKDIGSVNYEKLKLKHDLYSGKNTDVESYNNALLGHNLKFEEILKVPLVPNRVVLFDSSIFHRSDGLGSLMKPRIIQVFFFSKIKVDRFPIPEIRRI